MGNREDSIKRKKKKKESGKDGDCSKRNEAILVPPHTEETRPSFVLEKPFKDQGDKLGYVYLSALEKREHQAYLPRTHTYTHTALLSRPLLIRDGS